MENNQFSIINTIAGAAKIRGATFSIFSLIKNIIAAVVFIGLGILLIFMGLPVYIGGGLIVLTLIILLLSIKAAKNAVKVNMNGGSSSTQVSASFYPDESVIAVIPGIMASFSFGAPLVRAVSFGGTGEINHPENAIIITDKNIIFIYVPIAGGGNILGGLDVAEQTFYLPMVREEIRNKANALVAQKTIPQIYESYGKNFVIPFTNFSQVEFGDLRRNIVFITKDNKKHSYQVSGQEEFIKLKQIFQNNFYGKQ